MGTTINNYGVFNMDGDIVGGNKTGTNNPSCEDKSETINAIPTTKDHFLSSLTDLYQNMVAYREAVKKGDEYEINELTEKIQNCAQRIFLYYEYNQFSDKENAEKARVIVDSYNSYVDYYGKFISFPPGESRLSDAAQQYAKKTEDVFNSLIVMIIKILSEAQKG